MYKKFAATVATLALAGSALSVSTPANAAGATPTLTYTQLQATSGYAAFDVFNKASDAVLNAASGVHEVVSMNLSLGTISSSTTFTLDSNHTNATSHTVTTAGAGVMNEDYYTYYADGKYILDLNSLAANSSITNIKDALKKLGKPGATSMATATLPTSVIDINPAKTFGTDGHDPMALVVTSRLNMLFTEPVCSPISAPFVGNECAFDASVNSDLVPMPIAMQMVFDFDQSGVLALTSIKEYLGAVQLLDMTATQATITDFTQVLPSAANTVDEAVLTKASNQVAADGSAMNSAKQLVYKAKKFAAQGKKPISLANLTAAAKNLKLKTTKIKNGLKINTSWRGEKAAYCVTAVKGKTAQKPC